MLHVANEEGYTKIVVDGKLTHSDYVDILIPKFEEISKNGSIKIMTVISSFEGIEFTAIFDDLKTVYKHRKDFEKIAVVTNSAWINLGLNIFKAITSGEVKTFENEQDAQQWLTS